MIYIHIMGSKAGIYPTPCEALKTLALKRPLQEPLCNHVTSRLIRQCSWTCLTFFFFCFMCCHANRTSAHALWALNRQCTHSAIPRHHVDIMAVTQQSLGITRTAISSRHYVDIMIMAATRQSPGITRTAMAISCTYHEDILAVTQQSPGTTRTTISSGHHVSILGVSFLRSNLKGSFKGSLYGTGQPVPYEDFNYSKGSENNSTRSMAFFRLSQSGAPQLD